MLTYMAANCLGDVKYVSIVAICALPMIACVYAAAPFLLKRFDKIVLYRVCAVLNIGMNVVTFLAGFEKKGAIVFCMAVIAALAILPGILMGALPQDCIEYATFKTGIRKEGITFTRQEALDRMSKAYK